jgi:hypothetical protein
MDDFDKRELDSSFAQCPAFANHKDVATIHQDLQEIKETVAEMRDIIVAWQDAKAFFKVIKIIGEMLKWLVATGAAVGVIWYFVSGRNK